jgi:2-beta-glucuronyltransferase
MTSNEARRVVLVSTHYLQSKRRASYHNLAAAYWDLGWDVTFVTAGISRLSGLRGDYRFEYPVLEDANQFVTIRSRLRSFVLLTRAHPGKLPTALANRVATPWFRRYANTSFGPLTDAFRAADLIVVEGGAALLLVERIHQLAPSARLVYRVSDDLRRLPVHPVILEAELRALPLFDLVSTHTVEAAQALAPFRAVEVHPPGIDTSAFDRSTPSPYGQKPSAIFVGVSHLTFDPATMAVASELAPHVDFHVIGQPARPLGTNVTFHGELPFESVVPYMQHATMGLFFARPGHAPLGNSNKVAQYSYCRLPIVAPSELHVGRPNVCPYDRGDTPSLRRALAEAEQMPHDPAFAEGVLSAEELALALAGDSAGSHV